MTSVFSSLPSTQTLDTGRQLVSQGPQLLCKLFGLKAQLLLLPNRQKYLKDSEWNKLRYRLEKRFPALPDFDKISGSKSFLANLTEIRTDLSSCFQICCYVVDFMKSAKEIMEKIPKLMLDFKMRRNRPILLLWAEIFVLYMKLSYIFDLIPERFVFLPMYCAASQLMGIEISVQRLEEIRSLLVDGDNFQRKSIDYFSPLRQYIGGIILEMKDSIFFASDAETLRNNSVFNPVYDGNNMGLPSNRVLSASNDLSVYSEMCQLNFYYEFVALGVIAAPHFLFDETVLTILAEVIKYRVLIPLYRDLSINIHIELEKVSFLFPTESDKFVVPKGFKLQNRLKQMSRDSLKNIGEMQKKRRKILLNDLSTWGQLLQVAPGCVGPKVPVVLAACCLLKAEVVSFFRHYSGFLYRKDSKAHYDSATLKDCEDIGMCLYSLYLMENILNRSDSTVISYYLEYLFRADFEFLQQFEELFLNHLPGMIHMYETIARCTESFHLYHKDDTADILKITNTITDEYLKVVLFSSSPTVAATVNAHSQSFERFLSLTFLICDHCNFVCDRLRWQQYVKCINPYEAGWFRAALLDVFAKTMRSSSLNGSFGVFTRNKQVNYYAMMFFRPFQDILYNMESGTAVFYTDDSPHEIQELGDSAILFVDTMLTYVSDFVKASIKTLWEYLRALEAQYHPVEVINRIQRLQASGDFAPQHAFIPGMESDLWATSQIKEFIKLQEQLCNVLLGIHKTIPSSIQVCTRVYKVEQYIYENIIKHFKNNILDNFSTMDRNCVCRFSAGMTRFTNGLLTLQFIAQSLPNSSFFMALRDIVFSEIIPANLAPPIGIPYVEADADKLKVINRLEENAKSTVVYKVALWFQDVAQRIGRGIGGDSLQTGIVYVPHRRTFINLARFDKLMATNNSKKPQVTHKTNTTLSTSASSTINHADFAVEMYLSRDELLGLCRVIGAQGLRIIESQLSEALFGQLLAILAHLKEDKVRIEEFEQNFLEDPSAVSKMSKLMECKKALKYIGVILLLREHLMEAQHELINNADHDILSTIDSMQEALDCWADSSLLKQSLFYTLCSSMGISSGRDISLFTCLYERLKGILSFADMKILYTTLPTIGVAMLVSPISWQQNEFIQELEVFESDDYVIQYALAKLFVFNHSALSTAIIGHCDRQMMEANLQQIESISELLLKEDTKDFESVSLFQKLNINDKQLLFSSVSDEMNKQSSTSKAGSDDVAFSILTIPVGSNYSTQLKSKDISICRGSSIRDCANYIANAYLKLAVSVLLAARRVNGTAGEDLPFASITLLLEQFVHLHPAGISPGHLEKYLPYDLMHFDRVDVAVGKIRPSDSYTEFKALPGKSQLFGGPLLESAQYNVE